MAVTCPHCSSTLATTYNLKRHISRKHSEYIQNGSDEEDEECDNDQESDNVGTESDQDDDAEEEDNNSGGAESTESQTIDSADEDVTYTYDEVVAVLRFYLEQYQQQQQ